METCTGVVLTFKSVEEILSRKSCSHSHETSSSVLSHGTIYFSMFYKMKFWISYEFLSLALLGIKWLKRPRDARRRSGVRLQLNT